MSGVLNFQGLKETTNCKKNVGENPVFLLRSKFSSFSTQQKWAVEKRNETNKTSSSFCTKKHQNPFSSLEERVVWSSVDGFKKVPKTKTHTSRLRTMYVSVKVTYIKHYCQHMHDRCVFVFETFFKSPMQLQSTRSRRLLNRIWWFLVQNEAESLFVLFSLFQHTFVELKTTKTLSEVKNAIFPLANFQSCRQM